MAFISTLLTFLIVNALLNFYTATSSTIINVYERPLNIYWNAPTFQCRSHKIYFEELTTKYGIITNRNDSFKGDKITIMYDPGNFPAILQVKDSADIILRNGGVPQAGNLSEHLEMFKLNVQLDFPNENYNGVAIIDFESWRPIYRQNWGSLLPYKELSVDLEHEAHPTWNIKELKGEAEKRFEAAGRQYVEETLKLAKAMRPNATWGYYAYPYCFNMQSPNYQPDCSDAIMADNDRLHWMFTISDGLYPSVYLPQELTGEQRKQLIEGRIYEAIRIKGEFESKPPKRIYPYFWYVYRDTKNFLDQQDILNALRLFKAYGTDGVIIWGSSNDVNSRFKCELLYNYVDMILGPALLKANSV